jgi:transposase
MVFSTSQRSELESILGTRLYDGSVKARAQLVAWWDDGLKVSEIAAGAGVTEPTVRKWIKRFEEDGIDGLASRQSTGRPNWAPPGVRERIIALTKTRPPDELGLSHWSSREMAKYLKKEGYDVSHNFVATVWRDNGLRPHKQGTFKVSSDPDFEAKMTAIIGLYLDPPTNAALFCIDEKTQIQALNRTQPLLPVSFGKTEQRTADYVRHGTTNLFAAFDVNTGKVIGECQSRRRTEEFLGFMDKVVATCPAGQSIHVILDNLSTHKAEEVIIWLEKHPEVTFYFTPTGSSWLNQVETWFNIITKQSIRRGTFVSVPHLIKTIENHITHWNEECHPFAWTATADDITRKLEELQQGLSSIIANHGRKQVSITRH